MHQGQRSNADAECLVDTGDIVPLIIPSEITGVPTQSTDCLVASRSDSHTEHSVRSARKGSSAKVHDRGETRSNRGSGPEKEGSCFSCKPLKGDGRTREVESFFQRGEGAHTQSEHSICKFHFKKQRARGRTELPPKAAAVTVRKDALSGGEGQKWEGACVCEMDDLEPQTPPKIQAGRKDRLSEAFLMGEFEAHQEESLLDMLRLARDMVIHQVNTNVRQRAFESFLPFLLINLTFLDDATFFLQCAVAL